MRWAHHWSFLCLSVTDVKHATPVWLCNSVQLTCHFKIKMHTRENWQIEWKLVRGLCFKRLSGKKKKRWLMCELIRWIIVVHVSYRLHCQHAGKLTVNNMTGDTWWMGCALRNRYVWSVWFIVTATESQEDTETARLIMSLWSSVVMHTDVWKHKEQGTRWIERKEPPFSPAPRHSSVLIKIPHRKNTWVA